MNEHLWKCLVQRGKFLVDRKGWDYLINFKNKVPACGCNTGRNGEPECPCRMSGLVEKHRKEIVKAIIQGE